MQASQCQRVRRRATGFAAALAAFGLFAALAVATLRWQWFTAWDAQTAHTLAQQASPAVVRFLAGVSALHAPRFIFLFTVAAAAVLLWRRDLAAALTLAATVLGGATLNHLLKHTLQRPRPGLEEALGLPTDFSFPSGHVANATLLYGALAVLVLQRATLRTVRWAVVCSALLMVSTVGLSRLVLRVHWLSDVLAAVPVGMGWLAFCFSVAALLRQRAGPDRAARHG